MPGRPGPEGVEMAVGQPVDGMGAVVHEGGVTFRVWAPNADRVSVVGDFNRWDPAATPLTDEGNGNWVVDVAGAKPGDEYKYHLVNGKNSFDRIDPRAARVTNSVGNAVVYDQAAFDWQGDDFRCPQHNELVVYELHVGSFNRSGGAVGTFDDVLARLDHLVGLGVNAVELMPVMEFAGDLSWGYNPAHLFAVESAYGGPDKLKEFVRTCHQHGVAVLMDVVYNHFGPSDLDLWQFDGWGPDGKGGIYFYNDARAETPWGDSRPDYGREEVRHFIRDNAMMWLTDYRLDGLRWDMTAFIRSKGSGDDIPEGFALMGAVNQEVRERFPDKIMVAEDMHGLDDMVGEGEGQAWFHAQWDADFVHPVRRFIGAADDAERSMAELRAAVEHDYDDRPFSRVVFTESHDEVANGKQRVVADVHPTDQQGWWAAKRATLGAMVALTSPGIPMLFQGQEFLQGGWFSDEKPLDWNLNREHRGIVQLFGDVARLRRNWDDDTKGLTGGGLAVFHVNDQDKVMAYQRWYDHGPGDDVVVVLNGSAAARGSYRIGLPAAGHWELKLNSDSTVYSPDFGSLASFDVDAEDVPADGFEHSAVVDLAPYSVLVYSWKG